MNIFQTTVGEFTAFQGQRSCQGAHKSYHSLFANFNGHFKNEQNLDKVVLNV